MRFTWRRDKERRNIHKHGLDFAQVEQVFRDPFAATVWDGVVDHEERWRTIGVIPLAARFMVVVVVHTYPDTNDDTWIHVISLREATTHERRRYEISHF